MNLKEQLNRIQEMMGIINKESNNTVKEKLERLIKRQGLLEVVKMVGIDKVLKILELEPNDLFYQLLDDIFNNLTIERLYPDEPQLIAYQWLDKNGNKAFEKNHWGRFFIREFSFIKPIKSLAKNFLSLTNEEYEKTLINYLNTRYKEEFENRPILDIDKSIRFFDDDDAW